MIIVDPADSQTLYLASTSGVFRSQDGGLNWTQGTGISGDVRSLVLDTSTPAATRVLHAAYLQHRLEGGEPPSAQLYLQAVERFRQLPGAIRSRQAVSPPGHADGDQVSDEGGQE